MQPNKNLQSQINDNTFNLAFHPLFNHNPKYLADLEFTRCKELLINRLGHSSFSMMSLFKLYKNISNEISIRESKITKELELLCEQIIREIYNIPPQINLKSELTDSANINYDFDEQIQNKEIKVHPDRMKIIREEANKRIILNALVNGSSVHIWKSAYYIAKEKLDLLNPELVKLFDYYTSIVNFVLWQQDPENNVLANNNPMIQKQGICKIDFESGELLAKGVNFPVLLLETNKVALDYLICKGIPQDFNEEELKLYYAIADNYSHEFWHNLLSPTIWNNLLYTFNVKSQQIPKIISKLSKLDYEPLLTIFISMQDDKKLAK